MTNFQPFCCRNGFQPQSRQTVMNIKSQHMYHTEYNHAAYSKNVTPILNNGICGMDIFKIMPLFKICDTYVIFGAFPACLGATCVTATGFNSFLNMNPNVPLVQSLICPEGRTT